MKRPPLVVIVVLLPLSLTEAALARGFKKPAGAGARKVPLHNTEAFTCSEGAPDLTGDEFEFVNPNTNWSGDVSVAVSLKAATPDSGYDIWVNQAPGGCPLEEATQVAALHTDENGYGNVNVKVEKVAGAARFWVSAVGGNLVLLSRAIQMD